MTEQSLIVSMWQEILENYGEQDRDAFVGGGEEAVEQLEEKLGFELPREFADHVRVYCPEENLGVAELYQGTSLVSFDALGSEEYHEAYGIDELEMDDDVYWLVLAEDSEDALIVNLKDENCPVYYFNAEDTEATEEIAPNLAHGLYLLGYWQHLQAESDVDGDSQEWPAVIETFQAKLDLLAPGVTAKSWRFDRHPYLHLD